MTWSILVREPEKGALGIAVASRFFAVGALVPHIRDSRAAVATQAFVSPLWGIEGADRIAAGEAGEAVLADFLKRDAGAPLRQWHAIDGAGRIAAHTGAGCTGWCGHVAGPDVSVAGNMLAGPQVVEATRDAWLARADLPMAERLLAAMEAGEAAGGDKRGRQSACLRLHRGEAYPALDLRADDHAAPLDELRRLLAVSQERFAHFLPALPTRAAFSGLTDRAPVDAAIARAEAERAAAGRPSASFAVPPA